MSLGLDSRLVCRLKTGCAYRTEQRCCLEYISPFMLYYLHSSSGTGVSLCESQNVSEWVAPIPTETCSPCLILAWILGSLS